MKKVEIRNYSHGEVEATSEPFGFFKLPYAKLIRAEGDELEVSDGYHTFDELYEHRIRLFIVLCKTLKFFDGRFPQIWASTQHADGSTFGDWFVMGIGKEKGKQITYHLPARFWHEVCDFAEILEKAPEWDGHTSDDVLERLSNF